jgi:psiF repeat-containing protein
LNIRFASLVCAWVLALIVSETLLTFGSIAQIATVGLDGASSGGGPSGNGGNTGSVRLASESLPAKQDPAERSARSIECAQKADAQGLQGKTRKHFLRECKRGA